MKEIVQLYKEMKDRKLYKEAGMVEQLLGLLTGAAELDSEDADEETDLKEDKESDSSQEQVSLFNYTTKNFDLCPGAVKAFEHMKSFEMSGDSRERALNAIQDTDRLFEIEREVLESESATMEEAREAIGLSRSVSNYVGQISEEIDQDFTQDFEFLDMHIEKIMENLGD